MKKNNKNNKGFSLVELIIVIAIMAILIGVLAPQYLKFVERSRQSTDKQNVDEIVRAIEIYAADPSADPKVANDGTGTAVTLTTTGLTIGSGTNADAFGAALGAAGIGSYTAGTGGAAGTYTADSTKLKSSVWGNVTLTFKVDSDGNVKVTASCSATGAPNILE